MIIAEKRMAKGERCKCLKRILKSDSNNGKTVNTKQNTKNNKIIDGLGLIRCLRNMVLYKNS